MQKDKCSNCGTTKTNTFWTFEDHTMLCDKCHTHFGKKWQKDIEHDKILSVIGVIAKYFFLTIIGICILYGIYYYFLNGYGLNGYNVHGYDKEGFNTLGYNIMGYNRNGFDAQGYNNLGFNSNGYDKEGYNTNGYDISGYNRQGYDKDGYTRQGYNAQGYNRQGHSILGWCGDGTCNNGETCSSCSQDCGQCAQQEATKYTFQSYDNAEPYYSGFCDKINPYDLSVREAAAKAIRNDPGSYSDAQLFDIYDWVKDNIAYQNVALSGIPYPASDTLATESGDCKNQAVLIASMIGAIGGTAKVVADPSCEHAYTIVRFGSAGADFSWFANSVATHYGSNVQVGYFTDDNGIWVIFDPAGGRYPGNLLSQCTGSRTVYYIDSCRTCAQEYPTTPYTYGDSCYSECPQGTIHKNDYSCSSCPAGYGSYTNQCLTCSNGFILGTDGQCHQPCGSINTYCTTGTCFNGRCVTCQNGYSLHTDGKCY